MGGQSRYGFIYSVKTLTRILDSPVLFYGSTKHSNLGLAMTLKAPLTASVLSGSNSVSQVGDIRCSQLFLCYFT